MKEDILENRTDLFETDDICREELEILRSRLFLLGNRDKLMMSIYIEKGISYRKIALLLGINPTSVFRRVKKIKQMLIDGIYVSCMKNQKQFSQNEMSIARDYFLKGLSIKKIARRNKSSYYQIREKIMEIQNTANNL